jgi:clan AA aspartic protease (TIGR02281 family)
MRTILYILIIFTSINIEVFSQEVIYLNLEGGVYTVPCEVNGLRLKFIFDTGASDVSISLSEAIFMLKNDYLLESDIKGSTYYQIANGDVEEGTTINLRKLKIGSKTLYNVEASIVHSLTSPLLLGQSALNKIGNFSFDYSNNTLVLGANNNSLDNQNSTYEQYNNDNNADDKNIASEDKKLNQVDNDAFEYFYYSVTSKTYFYDLPDSNTKRTSYLINGDIVYIEKAKNGFGYIVFINNYGQTTSGWIKLYDLDKISKETITYELYRERYPERYVLNEDTALAFSCKLVMFPEIENNELLNNIYDIIDVNKEYWNFSDFSKNGLNQSIDKHKNYLEADELRKELIYKYGYDNYMLDEIVLDVCFINNKWVTVRYVFDGNRGGVSWYTEKYLTFNKQKEQPIKVSEIFNDINNTLFWNAILRKYADTKSCSLYDDAISLSENFYFDKHTITLIYNRYEIASGACGVIRITLPFSAIVDYLEPSFIKTYLQ